MQSDMIEHEPQPEACDWLCSRVMRGAAVPSVTSNLFRVTLKERKVAGACVFTVAQFVQTLYRTVEVTISRSPTTVTAWQLAQQSIEIQRCSGGATDWSRCRSCTSERINRRTSVQEAQIGYSMAKPLGRGTGDRHVWLNFGLASAATCQRCSSKIQHSNRTQNSSHFPPLDRPQAFLRDCTE